MSVSGRACLTMHPIIHAIIICCFCLGLTACGQKGPLILPEELENEPAQDQADTPAHPEEKHVTVPLSE